MTAAAGSRIATSDDEIHSLTFEGPSCGGFSRPAAARTGIVMAWNTSQMQAVLDRWSNRRQVIPPELIGKIAPTRLESINLRGVFRFPVDRYADQILPSRPNASITGTNG